MNRKTLHLGRTSAAIVLVGIICLALGVAVGYGTSSEKIVTIDVVQTSTITETQTSTTVEKFNVTLTPYCCLDPNVNSGTPCEELTTQDYAIQTLEERIEIDPSFKVAEGGHNYTSTGPPGCGSSLVPPTGVSLSFQFKYSIDMSYTDNCGDVGNFTYYLNVNVPLSGTGYNMSAIQIAPINSSEITISCSSAVTTTENTSVVITGTTSA